MTLEILLAVKAVAAREKSRKRSDRMKLWAEERRRKGLPMGRTEGARDKKPRKRAGYYASWEDGARRLAQDTTEGLAREHDESGRFRAGPKGTPKAS